MKLDTCNFVPFGRQKTGCHYTSNDRVFCFYLLNTGTAIPKPLKKQTSAFIFTTKICMSQSTYFENIILACSVGLAVVFLSSTICVLCIETKINFAHQNKGKITH